ncbi:MAG: cytoskeleton protein RodZ [Methyloprofundus sp.]|nr:MAG: cytoskeleton protein RodZ [Methyloprofundus sp.]
MKTEKKLTIKVRSKTERRIMEPELEMITEWNIKRIVIALLLLLLFIAMPAYYFSTSDGNVETSVNGIDKDEAMIASHDTQQELKQQPLVAQQNEEVATLVEVTPQKEVIKQVKTDLVPGIEREESHVKQQMAVEPEVVALHQNITRAQLAAGMNQREPFGEVDLPLLVNEEKAGGVFYFTEVINMKGKTVFHEWLFQDKLAYKRKFNIRGDRWRMATSKLFDAHYVGAWQVRIITQEGELLHKIDFAVQ